MMHIQRQEGDYERVRVSEIKIHVLQGEEKVASFGSAFLVAQLPPSLSLTASRAGARVAAGPKQQQQSSRSEISLDGLSLAPPPPPLACAPSFVWNLSADEGRTLDQPHRLRCSSSCS